MVKIPLIVKSPLTDIRTLYDGFDTPIATLDCGKKCAPHNPSGKPFCCDICHAVPAAYDEEWSYLQNKTDLWHKWRGDECKSDRKNELSTLQAETPEKMVLLACLGPTKCQRPYRALSCRQFPFFPYVTSDYRFIGLSYEWEFENTCWVVSNLSVVTETYRQQFVETHDRLFAFSQDTFDSYYIHSERMRKHFAKIKRRIPLLHRKGGYHLLSPVSERMVRIDAQHLPKFGPYKTT